MRQTTDSAQDAYSAGDYARAEQLCRHVLQTEGSDLEALLVLGATLSRTKRHLEAIGYLEAAYKIDPESGEALIWLSDALRKAGRYEDAVRHADRAAQIFRRRPDPLFTGAICLLAMGRYPEAESRLRGVVEISRSAQPLHYLGIALMRQDKLSDALDCLEAARQMEPNHPVHWVAMGQVLLIQRRFSDARNQAAHALELAPNNGSANLLMAQVMAQDGFPEQSETFIRKALAANPGSAEAHGLMGIFQQQMGHFSEAEKHLSRSLELDPGQATPLYCLVQSRKIVAADRDLVDRLGSLIRSPHVSPHERIVLEYALGKACDDQENYGEAMEHYDAANRLGFDLYRTSDPWDADIFERQVDRTIGVFTQSYFEEAALLGNQSSRPLFILGMIRSGTTLMEQMLSAHPDVDGAGELWFWMDEAQKCLGEAGTCIDPDRLADAASRYIDVLVRAGGSARFVTDKMPGNVTVLGFIHAALPNARIIHMVRDPIDTCLSIWNTYFRRPPEFCNHRGNIIHAFRQHERLRRHWREVLPKDRFMEVQYEELAADPKATMRAVLGFCGLNWEEACLRPQDNDRFVSTPSVWRVRRPIDVRSVNKRERYGASLGEFLSLDVGG